MAERWEDVELDESNSEIYRVEMTGEEIVWVARPGINLAEEKRTVTIEQNGERLPLGVDHRGEPYYDLDVDEGEPMPWLAPARGLITLRARSTKEARAAAIRTHPEYLEVVAVEIYDAKRGDWRAAKD